VFQAPYHISPARTFLAHYTSVSRAEPLYLLPGLVQGRLSVCIAQQCVRTMVQPVANAHEVGHLTHGEHTERSNACGMLPALARGERYAQQLHDRCMTNEGSTMQS